MKAFFEGAKLGAVRIYDDEEICHGVEIDAMESAEEAEGATHILFDGIVLGCLEDVESGDALKERVLASGVIFFEDMYQHLESVAFVCRVV